MEQEYFTAIILWFKTKDFFKETAGCGQLIDLSGQTHFFKPTAYDFELSVNQFVSFCLDDASQTRRTVRHMTPLTLEEVHTEDVDKLLKYAADRNKQEQERSKTRTAFRKRPRDREIDKTRTVGKTTPFIKYSLVNGKITKKTERERYF